MLVPNVSHEDTLISTFKFGALRCKTRWSVIRNSNKVVIRHCSCLNTILTVKCENKRHSPQSSEEKKMALEKNSLGLKMGGVNGRSSLESWWINNLTLNYFTQYVVELLLKEYICLVTAYLTQENSLCRHKPACHTGGSKQAKATIGFRLWYHF